MLIRCVLTLIEYIRSSDDPLILCQRGVVFHVELRELIGNVEEALPFSDSGQSKMDIYFFCFLVDLFLFLETFSNSSTIFWAAAR